MKKQASRSAQWPLVAEFVWSFNEWVVDSVAGTKKTFGSTVANSTDPAETGLTAGTAVTFDCINLPKGAVVCGGEFIVETAFVGIGGGATITIGVAGDAAALLGSTDLDAASANDRSALLLTKALQANGGLNVRITTAGLTATATAGKCRVRIMFTIDDRANEPIPA